MEILKKFLGYTKSLLLTILLSFVFVTIMNTMVFAKVQVDKTSMEGTLHDEDQVIIDKLSYIFSNPKKGDIVIILKDKTNETIFDRFSVYVDDLKSIIEDEELTTRYVKRVIGTPGDVIDIRGGYVYVNNEKLDEPYANGLTYKKDLDLPITVSDDKLFVLGDNRVVSLDSRSFGLVDYNQIDGKVRLRVMPFDDFGFVK